MRTTATLPLFLVFLLTLWKNVSSRPARVKIGDLLYEDGPLWEASRAEATFPDYGSGSAEVDSNFDLMGEAKNDESSLDLSENDDLEAADRHRRVRRSLLGRYKSHCRRRHGTNGNFQHGRFQSDEAKASPEQARRKARAPAGVYNNGGYPVVVQIKRNTKCRSRWCSMAYFLKKVKAYGFWKKNRGQTKRRADSRQNNMDFIDWNTLEAMP
ncbi:Hypp1449 [Branchiostoma lanceolatum]|uniref:Hypp1449 protein n=1 Tax=Branchiostoma lanceolatum TaxID=7740 RepID=A0A8J9ZJE2_BRALA|nr:Hypp1449 [Branchiostoma lanceolatum]